VKPVGRAWGWYPRRYVLSSDVHAHKAHTAPPGDSSARGTVKHGPAPPCNGMFSFFRCGAGIITRSDLSQHLHAPKGDAVERSPRKLAGFLRPLQYALGL
jgi:hypothetical protein